LVCAGWTFNWNCSPFYSKSMKQLAATEWVVSHSDHEQ
jgi:hypothetical protein